MSEGRHPGWGRHAACALVLGGLLGCSGARTSGPALDTRCERGEAAACLQVGRALERGVDDLPDPGRAARFYALGCRAGGRGSAESCWRLARVLRDGDGVKADAKRARALAQEGCTGGEDMGCLLLATMEAAGEGGPADKAGAARRFRRLCDKGLQRACNDLGVQQQDPATAEETFAAACAKGSGLACANLGVLRARRGAIAEAQAPLEQGCAAGAASACVQLAALLDRGKLPGGVKGAAALYQRACKLQDAKGCDGYALMLFTGRGMPARPGRAVALWKALCEAEHAPACFNLSVAYTVGAKGALAPNPAAAKAWRAKACSLGLRCPTPKTGSQSQPKSPPKAEPKPGPGGAAAP